MNPKTENWRAVLELEDADAPKFSGIRTSAEILAGMMRRGMLDALDEPPNAKRPATTPD